MDKKKRNKYLMYGGVAALVILIIYLLFTKSGKQIIGEPFGPLPTLEPGVLTINNPPYSSEGDGGNNYGGLTYVSNPPGNCGGKNYFVSDDMLANSQDIMDAQNAAYAGWMEEQAAFIGQYDPINVPPQDIQPTTTIIHNETPTQYNGVVRRDPINLPIFAM